MNTHGFQVVPPGGERAHGAVRLPPPPPRQECCTRGAWVSSSVLWKVEPCCSSCPKVSLPTSGSRNFQPKYLVYLQGLKSPSLGLSSYGGGYGPRVSTQEVARTAVCSGGEPCLTVWGGKFAFMPGKTRLCWGWEERGSRWITTNIPCPSKREEL